MMKVWRECVSNIKSSDIESTIDNDCIVLGPSNTHEAREIVVRNEVKGIKRTLKRNIG